MTDEQEKLVDDMVDQAEKVSYLLSEARLSSWMDDGQPSPHSTSRSNIMQASLALHGLERMMGDLALSMQLTNE